MQGVRIKSYKIEAPSNPIDGTLEEEGEVKEEEGEVKEEEEEVK